MVPLPIPATYTIKTVFFVQYGKNSLHNRSENSKRMFVADLGILIFLLRVRYNHVVYASRDDAKLCTFLSSK